MLQKFMLAVWLILMSAVSSAAHLRIHFVGAVDFFYDKKGQQMKALILVMRHPSDDHFGGTGGVPLDAHQAYVGSQAGPYTYLPSGDIVLTDQAGKLIPAGVVTKSKAFEDFVPLIGSQPPDSGREGEAVRFPLPAGDINAVASPQVKSLKWSVNPFADGYESKKGQVLYNEAILTVYVDDAIAGNGLKLTAGSSQPILIPFVKDQKRQLNADLYIGNAPPFHIGHTGGYQPTCNDTHFLLHHKMVGAQEDPAVAITPHLVSKKCVGQLTMKTFSLPGGKAGSREDCFAARWEY